MQLFQLRNIFQDFQAAGFSKGLGAVSVWMPAILSHLDPLVL